MRRWLIVLTLLLLPLAAIAQTALPPGTYTVPPGTTIVIPPTQPPPVTQYRLDVFKAGNGNGTVSGSGSYPAGTMVTPTATPATGSTFDGWTPPVPVLMDANKSVTAMFTLQASPPTTGGDIDALPPGQWLAIQAPLSAAYPNPRPPGSPSAVVGAWSGAAWDSLRNRLYVIGGGHQDYAGNEVYAFDLAALTWSRVSGPTPNAQIPSNASCDLAYADGTPSSRHTYDGLEYLPSVDKVVLLGGSRWACGNSSKDVWWFDPAAVTWSRRADAGIPATLSFKSGYDATTGMWYVNADDSVHTLWSYDARTEVWANIGGNPTAYQSYTAAIDTTRKLLVTFGTSVNTHSLATGARTPFTPPGIADVTVRPRGGIDYDPVGDKMVVWNGGADVWLLDLTANTVTRRTGTGAVPPALPVANGTFGRWRYIPSKDVFLLVNDTDRVYVYRPDWRTTQPPVTTYPLTVAAAGQGSVSGAGNYAAGATVTLGAVAAPGSRFDGWSSGCSPSFPMPAAPLACTATFTLLPVTPPSGVVPAQPGVFYAFDPPSFGGPAKGSKHVTWAFHPTTGRVYSMGGDFQDTATQTYDSYRQEQYAFDVAARWAAPTNKDAGWVREFPYCGPTGGIQPKSPDYVGWTWDSWRKGFWLMPGTMVAPGATVCPGRTLGDTNDPAYRYRHVMFYQPDEPDLTKRWTDYDSNAMLGYGGWQSTYDPLTDTLVRFGHDGGSGGIVHIYGIVARTWQKINLGQSPSGGDIRLGYSLPAVDLPNRRMYIVDPFAGRLYRYDMDARKVTHLGTVPDGPHPGSDAYSFAVWDSTNAVMLVWRNDTAQKLYIYDPATNAWTKPTWRTEPAGLMPAVNHGIVYVPSQNVTLFLGTVEPGGSRVWVYRYK